MTVSTRTEIVGALSSSGHMVMAMCHDLMLHTAVFNVAQQMRSPSTVVALFCCFESLPDSPPSAWVVNSDVELV